MAIWVVKFLMEEYKIRYILGQKSTEGNEIILFCRKVQKSAIQSQFSKSKMIGMFLNNLFIKQCTKEHIFSY